MIINKGVSFGDTHTYYDLGLILSESDIPPAEPKITYIDIPGADGSLDITEANGEVKFKDRELKFTFTIIPDDTITFEEKRTEVSNLINGRVFRITQDKDEEYYFEGRCTVDKYDSDKNFNQIVITAKVKPYKYKQEVTKKVINLTGTPTEVNISNSRKSVVPLITCTNDNTVIKFGGGTYYLGSGTHKILDILFVEGINGVTVSGSGAVTFEFQEGEL